MKINKIVCKSALTGKAGHFTLNPYAGCGHDCVYCYATFIMKYRNDPGPWGTWVDVKTNIAEVLEKQLSRPKAMGIFMATACEVYQPVENEFRLTRECLRLLAEASNTNPGLHVHLMTKSVLIVRDIDVIAGFRPDAFSMEFSMTTLDDKLASIFEPRASKPSVRIQAAERLKEAGINAKISLCPVLPWFTEKELSAFADMFKRTGLSLGGYDTLNYIDRYVGWRVRPVYAGLSPEALKRFDFARFHPDEYSRELAEEFKIFKEPE